MRTQPYAWLVFPFLLGCGGSHDGDRLLFVSHDGGAGASADNPPVTVTIDTSVEHQKLVGFGAAVAWYANTISKRGATQSDDIYSVLFPDLGLDILRIGNWYQNQSDDSTPDSPLGDDDVVSVVEKATAALGHPPAILMSSWSPPGYLKSNGKARSETAGTLKKEDDGYAYEAFAQWWVAALEAYGAKGIHPDYVSIQNEPDYFNAGWATCLFAPEETADRAGYGPALDAVYHAVQASSALTAKPKFVGAEASGLAAARLQNYQKGLDPSQIDVIGHHLYNGAGSSANNPLPANFGAVMRAAAATAAAADRPIFQTEYSQDEPTAFNTAAMIHFSLVVEGVAAYVYWKLVWDGNSLDPLVGMMGAYSDTNPGYEIRDAYYAVKHYAKWTDPGWVRVDATTNVEDVRASAFASPDGKALTVVLLNDGQARRSVTLDATDFGYTTLDAYRTSGSEERATSISVGDDRTIEMPGPSIVTAVFSQ